MRPSIILTLVKVISESHKVLLIADVMMQLTYRQLASLNGVDQVIAAKTLTFILVIDPASC